MADLIVDTTQRGIAQVTLNRPEKRNALNLALLKALNVALKELADNRVVILQGAGPVFSAGMDLSEAANPDLAEEITLAIRDLLIALYRSPLVIIAAVHGAALAGGAGLLAACDLVVAAEGTSIGFPETRRGLIAAQVSVLLRHQLPLHAVRELLLTGSLVDARRAYEMGLVNRIVPPQDLLSTAQRLASEILLGGPEAVKAAKRMLASPTLEADLDIAMTFSRQARASKEADEGIRAFLEKRKPSWE
jgi:methylglutaconyl-CoA hydratase